MLSFRRKIKGQNEIVRALEHLYQLLDMKMAGDYSHEAVRTRDMDEVKAAALQSIAHSLANMDDNLELIRHSVGRFEERGRAR